MRGKEVNVRKGGEGKIKERREKRLSVMVKNE